MTDTVQIENAFLLQSKHFNPKLLTDKFVPKSHGCHVLLSELTIDIHKDNYIHGKISGMKLDTCLIEKDKNDVNSIIYSIKREYDELFIIFAHDKSKFAIQFQKFEPFRGALTSVVSVTPSKETDKYTIITTQVEFEADNIEYYDLLIEDKEEMLDVII